MVATNSRFGLGLLSTVVQVLHCTTLESLVSCKFRANCAAMYVQSHHIKGPNLAYGSPACQLQLSKHPVIEVGLN